MHSSHPSPRASGSILMPVQDDECVADTVRRFGGFVAKYVGDRVLVYFGYSQAHEDDAERAVRQGLELVATVADLKTHTRRCIRASEAPSPGIVKQRSYRCPNTCGIVTMPPRARGRRVKLRGFGSVTIGA